MFIEHPLKMKKSRRVDVSILLFLKWKGIENEEIERSQCEYISVVEVEGLNEI